MAVHLFDQYNLMSLIFAISPSDKIGVRAITRYLVRSRLSFGMIHMIYFWSKPSLAVPDWREFSSGTCKSSEESEKPKISPTLILACFAEMLWLSGLPGRHHENSRIFRVCGPTGSSGGSNLDRQSDWPQFWVQYGSGAEPIRAVLIDVNSASYLLGHKYLQPQIESSCKIVAHLTYFTP